MKKSLLFVVFLVALSAFTFVTDPCETLFCFKDGTQTTVTSYDEDGNIQGKTVTLYTKLTKTDKGVNVTASQENFDKKGKSSSKNDFTIKCESGNLYFDMKMFIPQDQMKAYKDMQMTMEGNDMEIPAQLAVDQKLKDANVTVKVSSNGTPMPMMNFSFSITNRKVEKIDTVTTSAGTFPCFKISDEVEVKSIVKVKMKSISWFSPKAGMVKSETYKENGKFVGKTELTELKK